MRATLLLGLLFLSACHEPAERQAARDLPAAVTYTQLWQHPFELYGAARRSVAVASPCAIWLVAGTASVWNCAGDSLRGLEQTLTGIPRSRPVARRPGRVKKKPRR